VKVHGNGQVNRMIQTIINKNVLWKNLWT